jgi:hypothetical protein
LRGMRMPKKTNEFLYFSAAPRCHFDPAYVTMSENVDGEAQNSIKYGTSEGSFPWLVCLNRVVHGVEVF